MFMELSTFAYTIGVLELLFGLPLLFYSKSTLKFLDKFFKDDVEMRVVGALMTVLGALILVDGYEVHLDPAGLITLMAWAVFLKGLIYTWWPHTAINIKKRFMKSEASLTFAGIAATVIGVLLMYGGSLV